MIVDPAPRSKPGARARVRNTRFFFIGYPFIDIVRSGEPSGTSFFGVCKPLIINLPDSIFLTRDRIHYKSAFSGPVKE